ncbi:hypothetical protein BT69DRAFT_1285341, partial [Atractiella rhizophila]
MSSVLVTGWERGLKAGVGALEAISMGDSCLRQGLYATSPDAARKMVSLLLLLLCPHPKCYRVSIAERNSDTRSRDMLGCWAGTGRVRGFTTARHLRRPRTRPLDQWTM